MASITCEIEFARAMIDILSKKKGPVHVNTWVAAHNPYIEEIYSPKTVKKLLKKDTITIDKQGKGITIKALNKFFEKLKAHVTDSIFDNGRSYFFEGITKDDENYCINWGS